MTGGGTSTNTVSQTIPDWIKPYFQTALGYGSNLLSSGGPQYYPGQTVAPLNPVQEAGIQSTVNAAGNPYSPVNSASNWNNFATSGALMNPSLNPYLQNTFNLAANSVQNRLASEFAGSGSNVINSLPIQSDEMNNLATQLYGGAYGQGLQQTTANAAMAPSLSAAGYLPGQQLLATGSGLQNQTQNLINANQQAWNYGQQLPYNTLSWYSGLLGQNAQPFSSGVSRGQMQNSPWSTALGTGLMGMGLYNAMGGAGALGGLGSLFGGGAAAGAGIDAGTALADALPMVAMA